MLKKKELPVAIRTRVFLYNFAGEGDEKKLSKHGGVKKKTKQEMKNWWQRKAYDTDDEHIKVYKLDY